MTDLHGVMDDPQLKKWHLLAHDKVVRGPYSFHEIAALIEAEKLNAESKIWSQDFENWTTLSNTIFNAVLNGEIILFSDNKSTVSTKKINEEFRSRLILPPPISQIHFSSHVDMPQTFTEPAKITEARATLLKKHHMYVIAICATTILIVCGYILSQHNSNLDTFKNHLSQRELNEIVVVTKMSENNSAPTLSLTKFGDTKAPEFLIGSNLSDESKIKLTLNGIPNTLLGSYRYKLTQELKVKNKLAVTTQVRKEDGSYIPPGSYTATIESGSSKYTKTFVIGHNNDEQYRLALKSFHQVVRLRAEEELMELNDYALTLEDQVEVIDSALNLIETKFKHVAATRLVGSTIELQEQIRSSLQESLELQNKAGQQLLFLPAFEALAKIEQSVSKIKRKIFETKTKDIKALQSQKNDSVREINQLKDQIFKYKKSLNTDELLNLSNNYSGV
jgi:hypothetical protein